MCAGSRLACQLFLEAGIAIPGETSRKNLQGSPPDWVAVVSPSAQPFELVLPADIRGPQGPSGPAGGPGPSGPSAIAPLQYKGFFAIATAYMPGDVVSVKAQMYNEGTI